MSSSATPKRKRRVKAKPQEDALWQDELKKLNQEKWKELTPFAAAELNGLLVQLLEQVTKEAVSLANRAGLETITCREIDFATKLVLHEQLQTAAINASQKAVKTYVNTPTSNS